MIFRQIQNNNISCKQMQLCNTLRRLWMEHVMWTRSFILSTAFDSGDLDAVTKRLLQNPVDFAKAMNPYYGPKVARRFESLLTQHLLIAAQLVNAAKAGDARTAEEQRRQWYANADQIAQFLGNINPYWNDRTWRNLLYDHLKMTENEAVQILSGQYRESIIEYDAIQNEALAMADYMANGMIKQCQV
jgi:hypothetical protein